MNQQDEVSQEMSDARASAKRILTTNLERANRDELAHMLASVQGVVDATCVDATAVLLKACEQRGLTTPG